MFSTGTVQTIFANVRNAVGDSLTNNLGAILLIVGGLIGLGMLIRFFKKHVGKK